MQKSKKVLKSKVNSSSSSENTAAVSFSDDIKQKADEILKTDNDLEQLKIDLDGSAIEAVESEPAERVLTEEEIQKNEEQLQAVEETVVNSKSKKKKWMSLIFLLINFIIVAVILITQTQSGEGVTPLGEIIKTNFSWFFFLISIATFALCAILEGIKINILVKKETGRSRPFLSFKTGVLGRYYDCITPMATGGQPFQIFYLKNHGLDSAQAIAVPIGKYVFHQISYLVFITFIIFGSLSMPNIGASGAGGVVVGTATWLGYVLMAGVLLLILLLSVNKKVGSKLVGGALKIGTKLKLVKDYDKRYNSVLKVVGDFQSTVKTYVKSPVVFVLSLVVAMIYHILEYAILFFVYCTFCGFNAELFIVIITKVAMIDLASSFIPLPGGTGMAEFSFTALFASLFLGGTLFWALILWRIFSFYGNIMLGFFVMIYDYFVGNKKFEWQKKKWELESESQAFVNKQLSVFNRKKKKKVK